MSDWRINDERQRGSARRYERARAAYLKECERRGVGQIDWWDAWWETLRTQS